MPASPFGGWFLQDVQVRENFEKYLNSLVNRLDARASDIFQKFVKLEDHVHRLEVN